MTDRRENRNRRVAHRVCWRGRGRAFTLVELLTAMGVLLVLAAITLVAVTSISRSTRISSGTNTVTAALSNARALAMKNSRPVLVAFMVDWDPAEPDIPQLTRLIIAEWSGDTEEYLPNETKDRFVPVRDIPYEHLPRGIKVAGPFYEVSGYPSFPEDAHNLWVTQPDMRRVFLNGNEAPGRPLGIMYAADGTVVTRNSTSDARELWLDLNNDGLQNIGNSTGGARFFVYDEPFDEPNLTMVPFVAVYDDDQAREELDTSGWDDQLALVSDLGAYIRQFGEQIHFNRYTGVFMK